MSWLSKAVAVLVLALWWLATMHCDLEQVPGFQFLAWCHPQGSAPHQDNGCDGDYCSEVESGFYKMEEQAASAPMPLLLLSFLLPVWEATAPPTAPHPVLLNSSPPELPRTWQFSYRTALPPRAPSSVA